MVKAIPNPYQRVSPSRGVANNFDDMTSEKTVFILEQTNDKSGWVAAYQDGSLVICWDDKKFIKTLSLMFDAVPDTDAEQRIHMNKVDNLVEWLSANHFEKMHIEL
jgi:hypothetical protein